MDKDNESRYGLSEDTEKVVKLLNKHYEYLNCYDVEGVIGTIHSMSPTRENSRKILGQIFKMVRTKNELIESKCIGVDDDYIFIKAKQKTTKLEGPPEMKDNINISLIAARREGTEWKVWNIMPLEMTFFERESILTNL